MVPITGAIRAAWSRASDGDLRPTGGSEVGTEGLTRWVERAAGPGSGSNPVRRVHWPVQVHGAEVVTVVRPGPASPTGSVVSELVAVCAGPGDGLVSAVRGSALAVLTADCASLALGSEEGIFAAVHAGWRGLVAGVVEATVDAMTAMGASEVVGALGPCIHPECYEFSEADLATVAASYGDSVRGRTSAGRPALALPAAVSAALAAAGAREVGGVDACTACGGGYFSHRARGDTGRQALAVWSTDRGGPE